MRKTWQYYPQEWPSQVLYFSAWKKCPDELIDEVICKKSPTISTIVAAEYVRAIRKEGEFPFRVHCTVAKRLGKYYELYPRRFPKDEFLTAISTLAEEMLKLIREIPQDSDKEQEKALQESAIAFVWAQDLDSALCVTSYLHDRSMEATLVHISRIAAKMGMLDAALTIARKISSIHLKPIAFMYIAEELAKAGNPDLAFRTAQEFPFPSGKRTFLHIALAFIRVNNLEQAFEIIRDKVEPLHPTNAALPLFYEAFEKRDAPRMALCIVQLAGHANEEAEFLLQIADSYHIQHEAIENLRDESLITKRIMETLDLFSPEGQEQQNRFKAQIESVRQFLTAHFQSPASQPSLSARSP